MSTAELPSELQAEYEAAAQAYLRSLPPEHFMEATPQATQREITVESLALVRVVRPEVQYFNELLVQYPLEGYTRFRQVVPDNMVVLHDRPLKAKGSYDVPLQPARPFWMLEYVSRSSERKDYDDNYQKYEQELKVPYYLTFYPDEQELSLFRHNGSKYVSVPPNEHGRLPLPELDLEMGMLDGWARYWHQGELLPLPPELARALAQETRLRQQAERDREEEKRGREQAERDRAEEQRGREQAERDRAEEQRGREQAERDRAEEQRGREQAERDRAEEQRGREQAERDRAEEQRGREQAESRAEEQARLAAGEKRRADEQARLAAEEKRRADEEKRRVEEFRRQAEDDRRARLVLEQRLAELQAQLEPRRSPQDPSG